MDADAPAPPLFRFADPAAVEPDAAAPRRPAAWRAPVVTCAAAAAVTAGLIASLLPAGDPPDEGGPAGVTPVAASGGDDAEAVVSALHLSDGRPVRAAPVDTLPDEPAAVWATAEAAPLFPGAAAPPPVPTTAPIVRAPAVRTATADAPAAARPRVAPAVWLTGEIGP